MAGLALAYAPGLTDNLNYFVRNLTSLETMMVSVERLAQYTDIVPEPIFPSDAIAPPMLDVDAAWPREGALVFDGISMRYREVRTL